jgi:hypothetical protein
MQIHIFQFSQPHFVSISALRYFSGSSRFGLFSIILQLCLGLQENYFLRFRKSPNK